MQRVVKKVLILLIAVAFLFISSLNTSAKDLPQDVVTDYYSATITWVTDKPCTSQVQFGTDATYGMVSDKNSELVTRHSVILEDLTPGTVYHYRVISKDAFGNEAKSGDFTFETLTQLAKQKPPRIMDVEASTIIAAGRVPDKTYSRTAKASVNGLGKDFSKYYHEELNDLSLTAGQLTKKEEPIEEALIQRGGLLLSKGKWQIEPSVTYAHVSANRIYFDGFTIIPVLVVGEISSEEVKRDIMVSALTTRYGLTDNLQAEVRVPYRYQHDRISIGTTSESTRDLGGIGDVETAIQYQFAHEKGLLPDLIAGIAVKSDTGKEPYGRDIGLGTGHWAVKSTLVAVKSSDPAIVFGSIGYTHNIKRKNITDYGTVEPGQTFEYLLGAAFALNYKMALSLQLEQAITTKMQVNHVSVPGSLTNVVNFKYGLTWSISDNLSCDISATHGLTEDAPNFAFEVKFPITF